MSVISDYLEYYHKLQRLMCINYMTIEFKLFLVTSNVDGACAV